MCGYPPVGLFAYRPDSVDDIVEEAAFAGQAFGDDEITVGELTNCGYYLGSNISYNVKQLTNNDYIEQERSPHDRRSVRVKLSEKGRALRDDVNALFERHVEGLLGGDEINIADIADLNAKLRQIERFWSDQVRFRG